MSSEFPADVKIPKGSLLDKIEATYGPLAEAVHCGLVDCNAPHKKGFIVVFRKEAGGVLERALMGHLCGKREFGANWTKALARHAAERRAVEVQAEVEKFLEAAAVVEARLRELKPPLETCEAIRKILLIDARKFMRYCADACRSHNGLLEEFAYSENRKRYRLEGQLFFLQFNSASKARILLKGIAQIRSMAEEREPDVVKLRGLLARVGNLSATLGEIEKEAVEGSAALKLSNFTKALRVLGPFVADEVRMSATVLEVQRSFGSEPKWEVVADLANPQNPGKAYPWEE